MDTDRIASESSAVPSTNGASQAANSGPAALAEEQPAPNEGLAGHALALGLAAVLGFAGVAHFVRPQFFDPIVPDWMPGSARTTTYVSGVVELAAAVLVANPRTRRFGGWFAAATCSHRDFLDQFGPPFGLLRVGKSLLVLDRRPAIVTRHPYTSCECGYVYHRRQQRTDENPQACWRLQSTSRD